MKNISRNKLKNRAVISQGHWSLVIGQDHVVGKSHFTLYLPLHVLLPSIALKRPRSFNIQVNVTQYQGHINVNVKKNVFDVFSAIFCLILLPPANEVSGKVMFLHLCVILFTGRVGFAQTPWRQTHPPPDADPSRVGQTLPHPDTVNKRAVRILLECILICKYILNGSLLYKLMAVNILLKVNKRVCNVNINHNVYLQNKKFKVILKIHYFYVDGIGGSRIFATGGQEPTPKFGAKPII